MKTVHEHVWKVVRGGPHITNSDPGMMFKVCRCGAVEHISYAEARKMGANI